MFVPICQQAQARDQARHELRLLDTDFGKFKITTKHSLTMILIWSNAIITCPGSVMG